MEIVNSDIFQNFTVLGIKKWDVARKECKGRKFLF